MAELNELLSGYDLADDARRIGNRRECRRSTSPSRRPAAAAADRGVRDRADVDAAGRPVRPGHRPPMPLLGPGPADRPSGPGGAACLRAGRVRRPHGRSPGMNGRPCAAAEILLLDHYLEVLVRKPGALPGATALVQARAAGTFTAAHEAFWAAARKAHGDGGGTRALVEVLLLHRHQPTRRRRRRDHRRAGVGAVSPDVVAVETRKHAQQQPPTRRPDPVAVVSGWLVGRTPAGRADRPAPADTSTAAVGRRLRQPAHRNEGRHDHHQPTPPTRQTDDRRRGRQRAGHRRRDRRPPPGCCGCPRSGTGTARSPTPPPASSCPTGRSCPSCCSPSATTATNAAPPAGSTKRASPDPRRLADFDFAANTDDQPRDHQHPRRLRLGQQRPVVVLDRGQRHRQEPPAHRPGDRRRPGRPQGPVRPGRQARQRTRRSRRRTQLSRTIARYGRVDLLCLDELGYMELDKRGAELLFQVLTEREEKTAVAIASNEASAAGPRPSPTPGSAPPSSTASPSAATSSRPAPAATASPTPEANRPQRTTPGGATSSRHPGAKSS